MRLFETRDKGRARRWGVRAVVSLSVVVFLVLHFQNLVPVPAEYNPAHRLKGWDDLGTEVEELRLNRFKDPDKVFVMSSLYDLTAALAFYVPGQPRTYNPWIDRRMNQYDLWEGPQNKTGWDAIYVRKRFHDAPDHQALPMCTSWEGPIKYQTTHRGKPARKFTLFLCRNYTGYWPRPDNKRF